MSDWGVLQVPLLLTSSDRGLVSYSESKIVSCLLVKYLGEGLGIIPYYFILPINNIYILYNIYCRSRI